MHASVQRSLGWKVGIALDHYPTPRVEPHPRLGDPLETLDPRVDSNSIFAALSLYVTGTLSYADNFRQNLVSWIYQNYCRNKDLRAHLPLSQLQWIERQERATKLDVPADVSVPHRRTPVEHLDVKALVEARVHRLLVDSLAPSSSWFELQAVADAFGVSFYTYMIPDFDPAWGRISHGTWVLTEPMASPERSGRTKHRPVIYLATTSKEGSYSLVSKVDEPFTHAVQRAQLLHRAEQLRAEGWTYKAPPERSSPRIQESEVRQRPSEEHVVPGRPKQRRCNPVRLELHGTRSRRSQNFLPCLLSTIVWLPCHATYKLLELAYQPKLCWRRRVLMTEHG